MVITNTSIALTIGGFNLPKNEVAKKVAIHSILEFIKIQKDAKYEYQSNSPN